MIGRLGLTVSSFLQGLKQRWGEVHTAQRHVTGGKRAVALNKAAAAYLILSGHIFTF